MAPNGKRQIRGPIISEVTGFASEVFYFINRECCITFPLRLMTAGAGNIDMLAVEPEGGLVMIELRWRPAVSAVTGCTVRTAIEVELPVVYIIVTCVTIA